MGRKVARGLPVDVFQDVQEFHDKFGLYANHIGPYELPAEIEAVRTKFLFEELNEYLEARKKGDVAGQFDALIDLIYVAVGHIVLRGFPFYEGWRRVQQANMAKVRAERPDQSKRGTSFDVVKPEGWTPPDLASLLRIGSDRTD
jgi:predicted HAD superfamily Cof-like phosphohydrolase